MATSRRFRRQRLAIVVAALLTVGGCSVAIDQRDPPPWQPIPEPRIEDVENVVFIVGDAGATNFSKSPLLYKLHEEIEAWSGRLARDSAVILLVLGDNIYPVGLHPRGHPYYPQDSVRLLDQARLVGGPNARRFNSPGIFVAGNHDWAIRGGVEGENRLKAQAELLDAFRAEGLDVRMHPPAGEPGPAVIDFGQRLRMILIDTAWWVLTPSRGLKSGLLIRLEQAMRTRGERSVIVAGHHPFESGGAHGEGLVPVWKTLGIKYFLARSGALLQNLNSLPLREYRERMMEVFQRTGPPLVYAGGHEHSLQVLERDRPNEPHFGLVSGTASKLTNVGYVQGQRFRASAPGYMRLMVLRDGTMALFVVGLGENYLYCDQADPAAKTQCIADGIASARVLFSAHLREQHSPNLR